MKTITQRLMKILLVALMMIIPLGINNSVVYAEDDSAKELAAGTVYNIGDVIKVKDVYLLIDDDPRQSNTVAQITDETYKIEGFEWESEYWQYGTSTTIGTASGYYTLWFGYNKGYSGTDAEKESITGIKCASGDGTEGNPFTFELVFKKELAAGVEYKIGDTIKLSGNVHICFDDDDTAAALASVGEYQIPDATFENPYNMLGFEYFINMVEVGYPYGLYFYKNLGGGLYTPTGIRCISGDGSKEKPFTFEPTFSKELAEGVEYKIGDTIKLSDDAYIKTDDETPQTDDVHLIKGREFLLNKPKFPEGATQFKFKDLFEDEYGYNRHLNLGYGANLTGKETVTGIRCISGDGKSEDTAFKFELMFDTSSDPTVIDEITLTITPPTADDTVSGDWISQEPRPEISVPENPKYYADLGDSYWITEELDLYEGTFEENEYYYVEVALLPKEGYAFAEGVSNLTVNITNGEFVDFIIHSANEVVIMAKVKCKAAPQTNGLKVGDEFLIGDTIKISEEDVWISFVDTDDSNVEAASKGEYALPEPTFNDVSPQCWVFESFISMPSGVEWGLYFYNDVSAEKKPIGVRCAEGDGTESNPFKFELMYELNPIINAITVTITPPKAGVTVSGDWSTQAPRPEVSIPIDPRYNIYEQEVYWFDDIETYKLFEGTFEENEYYYFGVPIGTEDGYKFVENSSDLTVNITNGEFVKFDDYEQYELVFFGKVKCKAAPQTKELKAGEEYLIGDTIKLTKNETICFDNENGDYAGIADSLAGEYTLPEPKFYDVTPPEWGFEDVIKIVGNVWFGFYYRDEKFEASNKPIGIECISGNGTPTNPFMFEPLFDEGPVINKVKLTITQPIPGDTVSGGWQTQTPRPEVVVPSSAKYNVEIENVYWFNEDLTVFEGTFEENEYYYFLVPLYTEDGHTFVENSSDLTVNIINGELAQFYYYEPTQLGIIGKVKCKAAPQTKELKVGEKYFIGDKIKISEGTWINFSDDEDELNDVLEGEYELPEPWFNNDYDPQYWVFDSFISVSSDTNWGLYFLQDVSASKKPIGVKCISGEGTQSSPFIFELMFETPLDPTIIDKVEFTIVPPKPGDIVTAVGDDWSTQNPRPVMNIPDDAKYALYSNEIHWTNSNGSLFTGEFIESEDYYVYVTLRTNSGYTFADSPTLNVINSEEIKSSEVDATNEYFDVLLKIKCQKAPTTHKVTFILNDGEMSPSEVDVEDGEYLESYKYEPTRLGQYTFEGWYTDSGCQNEFRWWETPIESALTLYAKWSEYYLINYDFGGGVLWDETGSTFNYPKEWEKDLEEIPTIEEMEDWGYQAPAGTRYVGVNINGVQYLPGAKIKVKENLKVTLINLSATKDILTFDLDGGKLGDQVGVAFLPYDNGQDIELPAPTKDGATFDYWEGSKYYAGDPYTVNGDKVFKAVWKSNPTPKPNYSIPKTGVE